MSNRYLMAVDAGTGSVRAVIFDLDSNQIAVEQREWTHLPDPRYPGSQNFDVERNFGLVKEVIHGAIRKAGIDGRDILAVSSDSMREGIVLYDAEGRELWSCANVDARAGREAAELMALRPGIEEDIYHESGQAFALGALARILWVKKHEPELYGRTRAVTMLNDWITYRLSGTLSVEPSNGCTTGIFDLKRRAWDADIAGTCGLRTDIFPAVHESGAVLGRVKPAIAAETGLSPDCLVVAGGGDAQLGCVGVGAVRPGQMALFGGSFWQLEYNSPVPQTDKDCRLRVNCHVVPDLWQFELLAFYPGLVMRWFRDTFCDLEKLTEERTGVSAYSLLDREAADVPAGSNGLVCTFSDVMNYLSWKHAAPSFINFDITQEFSKKVFYHALLENAALVTLGHLKIVSSITGKAPQKLIFASGASESPLWSQIVADVLGCAIVVPKIKEATALGTAICAGVGAGVYPDIAGAGERFMREEKTYLPDEENHKAYLSLYEKWRMVYSTQLSNANAGLTRFMWNAPGTGRT